MKYDLKSIPWPVLLWALIVCTYVLDCYGYWPRASRSLGRKTRKLSFARLSWVGCLSESAVGFSLRKLASNNSSAREADNLDLVWDGS